jgi:hypothetical protein
MKVTRAQRDILDVLHPEDGAQWLPGHWIAHALDRRYRPHVANDLAYLHNLGLVERRKQNASRVEKHSVWGRTLKADAFLGEKVKRSSSGFEHQVLDDMWTTSLMFGAEANKLKLERWKDILLSGVVENPRLFKAIRERRNPHSIDLKELDQTHLFDGKGPLKLSHEEQHVYLFREIDRDTEQGRATINSTNRQTWTYKIRRMKTFAKLKYWQAWYGFDCHMQLIVTVNETAKKLILEIIKEEIGPCKYIAVAAWKDWANNDMLHGGEERYPQPDGWALTTPYERVGYPPYQLNKFWQIDAKL